MFKIFKNCQNLVYGISTISDGNMSFRFGNKKEVFENRKRFLTKFNIPPKKCVGINLLHGNKVLEVFSKDASYVVTEGKEGDASLTNEKEVFLFMKVADCLPVILFDSIKNNLALVHCGWKSTDKRILQKTIKKMTENYGSKSTDILVAIGPGIHKESYWFKDPAQKNLPGWKNFLHKISDEKTAVDIVGYNLFQLKEAGIPKKNIEVSSIDTGKDNNYFSHFRSKSTGEPEGRFCVVAGIRDVL